MNWDAFISHASEDKETIVRKIAESLQLFGVKIWYDEFSLKVGDSLSGSIDEGLNKSNYGIVIISKHFIEKGWPEYEYRSLLVREVGYKKVILPIWHEVTKEDVKEFAPYLADKFALDTQKDSIEKLTYKLLEIIRPDIFENYHRYLIFLQKIKHAKIKMAKPEELKRSEFRHSSLSRPLITRIAIIHSAIGKYLCDSLETSIDNFKADLHPEREIQVWEMMTRCFLEFIGDYDINDDKIKEDIAKQLLLFSIGEVNRKTYLNLEDIETLVEIWKRNLYIRD